MGLIEIEIVIEEQQNYTDEYFGHKITELGIDFLLSNEKRFVARKSLHLGEKTKATNDLDEKIPF